MATTYFEAVYTDDLDALRALLERRVVAHDDTEALAGFRAAIDGNLIQAVEVFLQAGIDLNAKDTGGGTPLIWAVSAGRAEIVRRLLAEDCDVSLADSDGMTPLHHAAFRQDLILVEMLLKSGADVSHRNCEGKTALDLARLRRFVVPPIPLIGPGQGVFRGLWDTPVAKYLQGLSRQKSSSVTRS